MAPGPVPSLFGIRPLVWGAPCPCSEQGPQQRRARESMRCPRGPCSPERPIQFPALCRCGSGTCQRIPHLRGLPCVVFLEFTPPSRKSGKLPQPLARLLLPSAFAPEKQLCQGSWRLAAHHPEGPALASAPGLQQLLLAPPPRASLSATCGCLCLWQPGRAPKVPHPLWPHGWGGRWGLLPGNKEDPTACLLGSAWRGGEGRGAQSGRLSVQRSKHICIQPLLS